MRFDVMTVFPGMMDSYLNESIIKRARAKRLISVRVHNVRDFSQDDKHRNVDDRPYGGGAGMVLQAAPLVAAVRKTVKKKQHLVVLFSAAGRQFDAKAAARWAKKYKQIVMIAGRYEGVDERTFKILQATRYNLQAISIGPYVLTGGELAAMVVIDAVSRYIPGVLGHAESVEERRYGVGVPVYTRPEVLKWRGEKYAVPRALLSGDHRKIEEWRKRHRQSSPNYKP